MFGKLGLPEIGLILGIIILIFGPRRLPELGKSLGSGIRNFKGAFKELHGDEDDRPNSNG